MDSDANWSLIRSSSRSSQGTEIEPGDVYGTTHTDLTRRFTDEWKPQRAAEAQPWKRGARPLKPCPMALAP